MDSRFRGNDIKGSGNDREERGNDIKGSGNDRGKSGNDIKGSGNPKNVGVRFIEPVLGADESAPYKELKTKNR